MSGRPVASRRTSTAWTSAHALLALPPDEPADEGDHEEDGYADQESLSVGHASRPAALFEGGIIEREELPS